MNNILVTGATGFLGFKTSCDLVHEGYRVYGQGRNQLKGEDLLKEGVEFISIDLREDLSRLTQNMDCVVHCAALSSPWGKKKDFFDINVTSTLNLMKSAIENGVKRFIYISSPSVYFNFKDRFDIKETDPVACKPPSLYTQTKLIAEEEILKFKEKIEIIILRPRGIFGPEDTSLIPRIIKAYDRRRLRVIGNKNTLIDITFVDNVSHAIVLSINAKIKSGEIFNITNGEPVLIWDLINTILKETNRSFSSKRVPFVLVYYLAYFSEMVSFFTKKEPTFTRYTTGLLAKSQTLNIDKARKYLGYGPIVSMKDAINITLKWYKNDLKN